MNTTNGLKHTRRGGALRLATGALALMALAACDFEVTNPGPVQDANLDDPGAHEALVTGSKRSTLMGLSWSAHYGGGIVRDHSPGGHQQAGGVPLQVELGQLDDENTAPEAWDDSHQGRWIAEQNAARIRENLGSDADSYSPLGRLLLWAGFANRTLGESFCTGVIDIGPTEPNSVYFERAIEHFTSSAAIAQRTGENQVRLAALVGRADAHVFLGNWSEAAADASQVPLDFEWAEVFPDGERYRVVIAASPLYRGASYWMTPFEEHFPETGDERVAWGYTGDGNDNWTAPVARGTWGTFVPFYYPLKYYAPRHADELTRYAPIQNEMYLVPVRITSGVEAQLILAEAALEMQGAAGIVEAMGYINAVRTAANSYYTGEPLEPLPMPGSLDEAFAVLKFERLIEFTMEGRRFGARRRWRENSTPGDIHALEYIPENHQQRFGVPREQELCFPLPRSEKEQNPNISLEFNG